MEPKRGLFAGGGTTVRLPRQIPWPQAMEFLLCADLIPAERAFEMGLLNAVVPARAAARHGARVRGADRRQRAARGAGHEAERAAGPLRRRGRHEARCATRCTQLRDLAAAGADPAAIAEVLDGLRKELRTPFEKESRISSTDLPDRGREGRPEGVRREASARLASEVSAIDSDARRASSVSRAHVASRRRRSGGRARAARHVGARRACRRRRRGQARCDHRHRRLQPRLLPDVAVRRRGRSDSPTGSAPTRSSGTTRASAARWASSS